MVWRTKDEQGKNNFRTLKRCCTKVLYRSQANSATGKDNIRENMKKSINNTFKILYKTKLHKK